MNDGIRKGKKKGTAKDDKDSSDVSGNGHSWQDKIIHVDGMSCSACVKKIEKKLNSLDGVSKARVRLEKDAAKVRFDPDIISVGRIEHAIEDLGYSIWGKAAPSKKSKSGFREALAYGVFPHIGCIAFILGSVLGVTFMMTFFRPLLMNRYIFHIMVAMSIVFATVSSVLYLRKNGLLSYTGAKKKWKYLSTMYSVTIGANVLLLLVIFPLVAAASGGNIDLAGVDYGTLRMDVDIPCAGHAPLIMEEVRQVTGVLDVEYVTLGEFNVYYDEQTTSQDEILSIEVFGRYPATPLEGSTSASVEEFGTTAGAGTQGCGGAGCGTGGCAGGCAGGCGFA